MTAPAQPIARSNSRRFAFWRAPMLESLPLRLSVIVICLLWTIPIGVLGYLLKDVIPTVEAQYRVSPGRENRAIAGLSMRRPKERWRAREWALWC